MNTYSLLQSYYSNEPKVEVVVVVCVVCGKSKKAECSHDMPDKIIANRHFKYWWIKGVHSGKTVCPDCIARHEPQQEGL